MSISREDLNQLLKGYKKQLGDDLVAALILNRDGLVIDAIGTSEEKSPNEEIVGGVSGLVEPILKRITKEFDSRSFGTGTFDTEDYRLIFCEAGPHGIFVTILDSFTRIDPVFPYAYLAAEKISRIFDKRPVNPEIPPIKVNRSQNTIERKVGELRRVKVKSGDYAFKLILGGDGGVGKTSMVHRFVEDSFQQDYKATIGTSIMKKSCRFEGLESNISFIIWDLAGQKQFRLIRRNYLKNARAGIIVYDVTRPETFESIERWHEEITRVEPKINLILVGNKIDLERKVAREQAEKKAEELGVSYEETSAKTGENIEEVFRLLALHLINRNLKTE
ncbi:MAG: GTP-binding protein [Promethearchaeia archaeon]